jgi:hypothetical protein
MQSFTQLLQRLADAGIEFVIVGGYAAVAHGSTIVTRDLDICALLTPESVAVLRRALAEFHPRHRLTPHRLSFLDFPKGAARGYSLFVGRYSGAAERRYSLFVNRYSGEPLSGRAEPLCGVIR